MWSFLVGLQISLFWLQTALIYLQISFSWFTNWLFWFLVVFGLQNSKLFNVSNEIALAKGARPEHLNSYRTSAGKKAVETHLSKNLNNAEIRGIASTEKGYKIQIKIGS